MELPGKKPTPWEMATPEEDAYYADPRGSYIAGKAPLRTLPNFSDVRNKYKSGNVLLNARDRSYDEQTVQPGTPEHKDALATAIDTLSRSDSALHGVGTRDPEAFSYYETKDDESPNIGGFANGDTRQDADAVVLSSSGVADSAVSGPHEAIHLALRAMRNNPAFLPALEQLSAQRGPHSSGALDHDYIVDPATSSAAGVAYKNSGAERGTDWDLLLDEQHEKFKGSWEGEQRTFGQMKMDALNYVKKDEDGKYQIDQTFFEPVGGWEKQNKFSQMDAKRLALAEALAARYVAHVQPGGPR